MKRREDVAQLAEWCGANNLSLNVGKKEGGTKFLGVHITENLTWTTNTMSLSKKAQQHLHFLRRLKSASLPPPILTTFYRGTIESVLTSCPSLKPHTNPLPPETWTISPPLPHHKNKLSNLFVQFKVCYTQVSGPVQTTCSNTLSPMRTRHFSHTTLCTLSHK